MAQMALLILSIIIPTALTIFGWHFVYREGNRLAKRNEALNLFHIARKILETINIEAEKIWLNAGQTLSELDEAKLTTYCAEFELSINQIKDHYCNIPTTDRDIAGLRRVLTANLYPIEGKVATNDKRIKEMKIIISNLSLNLLDSTYKNINQLN